MELEQCSSLAQGFGRDHCKVSSAGSILEDVHGARDKGQGEGEDVEG
jgi:hypothetical protein